MRRRSALAPAPSTRPASSTLLRVAASYRRRILNKTGHAVLPHPAFRGRSPGRCRRCHAPSSGSTQSIYPKPLEVGPGVTPTPVSPGSARLLAQKQRHPFMDIAIYQGELLTAVAQPKVGTPAAQHWIQFRNEVLERLEESRPRRGNRLDALPHALHRPPSRPHPQVPSARPSPAFHLARVAPH